MTLVRKFINEINIAKSVRIALYVLAILVLACYMTQFYVAYAIDELQVLPRNSYILINILRWLTMATVGFSVATVLFGARRSHAILIVLALAVGIMNLVLYKENMIAWGMGRESSFPSANGYAYTPWRAALFVVEQIGLILLSPLTLYQFIKEKEYAQFKPLDALYILLILIGTLIIYFYGYFFENMYRVFNKEIPDWETTDFSAPHIIFLLLNPALIIGLYFLYRNKELRQKKFMLFSLGLGSVFSFFYCRMFYGPNPSDISASAIPIHICNLATVLVTLSYTFKLRGLFYFTFFVNVIGTIFAMAMPDGSYIALTQGGLRFWYNHIIVFVAPILGVVLQVYEKPKLKDIGLAIGVFAVYFLIAAFCNAWFNSGGIEVDYFFINTNFYADKVHWYDCALRKEPYLWTIHLFGHDLLFYPAYHLLVFVVFIAFMFLLWYLYDTIFSVADAHKKLHIKKQILKKGYADLKKLLNGRSIKEPLYEEGKGMIEIKNFTKIYAGSDKPSVDHLNLTIHDGEVYGFLGHNGAGKSTTIKSLVGIQTITDGQMIVNGYDVAKQPVETKLMIGYVSDNHAVYEKLTGREYINYIADLYMVSQEDRDARIEKYVKMFKLEDAIDREAKSYSHGMKQKLVVIASLIHDPKVWVLDEPLTGLDPTSAYQIKECMKEHASRGNIVFFSSHVIEVVEKICTRICIISHGKLMCEYSLQELKDNNISLEELYLKYVSSEERLD